jgi:hypothetical protein
MCRLTKYMLNRQFRFLGPYLPLSSIAREVYEGEISRLGGPAWITEPPVPPTAETINGDWIFAEAEADPYFYDSDSHGYEIHRVYWRSLRYNALIQRLEGRPNYGNEEWLKLLMPEQFKVHRSIIAPTLLQTSSTRILQSTKESAVATNNISKSRSNSSTTPRAQIGENGHRSAENDKSHAAKRHHLREHPMRLHLLRILKLRAKVEQRRRKQLMQYRAQSAASNQGSIYASSILLPQYAHYQPQEEGTYFNVNGGESSSSANHNSPKTLPGSEEISDTVQEDDVIVPDEI